MAGTGDIELGVVVPPSDLVLVDEPVSCPPNASLLQSTDCCGQASDYDKQGVTISWRNINYVVKFAPTWRFWKREKKTILSNLNGLVPPGKLLAIMGPSGCGTYTIAPHISVRASVSTNPTSVHEQTGKSTYVPDSGVNPSTPHEIFLPSNWEDICSNSLRFCWTFPCLCSPSCLLCRFLDVVAGRMVCSPWTEQTHLRRLSLTRDNCWWRRASTRVSREKYLLTADHVRATTRVSSDT